MKKFIGEFKEFINRGNVMDLAVGVIIGGAFTSIVTALTDNIINPFIAVIAGGGADAVSGLVVPGTDIDFGAFISAVINFLIVAFVVFLLVKAINNLQNAGSKILHKDAKCDNPEASLAGSAGAADATGTSANGSANPNGSADSAAEPATCPFCKEEIKPGATRCPHCTAEIPQAA